MEICFDNVYGTVCDDQWGLHDAVVVCRQLGFSDAGMCTVSNEYMCCYRDLSLQNIRHLHVRYLISNFWREMHILCVMSYRT